MRVSIASARPVIRAGPCWGGGSFPTRIEMKMMLSSPRTISSSDKVRKASQFCGSEMRSSMVGRQESVGPMMTGAYLRQVIDRGLLDRREDVLGRESAVQRD